jgi:DNA transformation protein and related proteins
MAVSRDYLAFVLEQLREAGDIQSRRMFGGVGLYLGEVFFALIADDTLYLRVDEDSRPEYTARDMRPFKPYANRALLSSRYYEVPADVLEDSSQLGTWARRALAAATRGA